jgi:hypothetical protein
MWLLFLQWIFGLLAAVLVVIGLFWDRPGRFGRPALRCRKCLYDLTRSKEPSGVSSRSPVVCPECGREHRTMRSMMRTRRSKRFFAAALVLLIAFHGVRILPAVKARGWIAGVPGVGLIATVPFFSEKEGSSDQFLSSMGLFLPPAGPNTKVKFDEMVFDEMLTRLRGQGEGATLGWPSRRLLFLLGRLEDADTVTDALTLKGVTYRTCVSQWIKEGLVFDWERSWAHRQIVLNIMPKLSIYDGSNLVYGEVRARYLSGEVAWLSNSYHARLKLWRNADALIRRVSPYFGPGITIEEARERIRFDHVVKVDRDGHLIGRPYERGDSNLVPLGYLSNDQSVTFRGRVAWRESDRLLWKSPTITTVDTKISIPSDQFEPVPVAAQSAKIEYVISNRIEPELYLEYDSETNQFRPALRLKRRNWGSGSSLDENVLFGGRVEIKARPEDSKVSTTRPIVTLKSMERWWLIENDHDYKSSKDWRRMIKPGIIRDESAIYLKPSYGFDSSYYNESDRLIVCITNHYAIGSSTPGDFQGLQGADAFYTGDLEIPLYDWTPKELRRFMVSGYLPDHAME